MPPASHLHGTWPADGENRRSITVGALFAGVAAAFYGALLLFTFWNLREAFASPDGVGELVPMVMAGILIMTVMGFWYALPLTLPTALILAHLSPRVEPLLSPADLCWVQYGAGAGTGFSIMLAVGSMLEGGAHALPASLAGLLAALIAVRIFRRSCLGGQEDACLNERQGETRNDRFRIGR